MPQLFRGRVLGQFPLDTALHVDAVDPLTVGGIGEADGQLGGVLLGLTNPFRQRLIPRLSLHHRQLGVAVFQHIVSLERLPAPAVPFDPALGYGIFAPDAAPLHHTPACGSKGGINMFGAGFGFVHALLSGLISDPFQPVTICYQLIHFLWTARQADTIRWDKKVL